jgi:hypothetical protein
MKGRIAKVALTMTAGLLIAALPVTSAFASGTTGTATLTAGTLSMNAPTTVGFAATLTGAAQVVSASQAIDVLDDTGSGAGWNITLTSTTWTSGANSLATTSTTDTAANGTCDVVSACVLGNNASISYPLVVPAGTTAPTALKIQSAAAGTGIAPQTWTHTMALAIPAAARAGAYTSTWTYSLVSGP